MQKDKKRFRSNKPSEELRALLKAMKAIEPGTRLTDAEEIYQKIFNRVRYGKKEIRDLMEEDLEKHEKITRIVAWGIIEQLSVRNGFENLVNFIVKTFPLEDGYSKVYWFDFYSDFISKYNTIREIACFQTARLRAEIVHYQIVKVYYDDRTGEKVFEENIAPFYIPFEHKFTEDGNLEPADPLVKSLYEIELKRLRICPVCEHVFWAYRLNQSFCEKKCSDIYFQRKRRADSKTRKAINEKRQANYAYKKSLKE